MWYVYFCKLENFKFQRISSAQQCKTFWTNKWKLLMELDTFPTFKVEESESMLVKKKFIDFFQKSKKQLQSLFVYSWPWNRQRSLTYNFFPHGDGNTCFLLVSKYISARFIVRTVYFLIIYTVHLLCSDIYLFILLFCLYFYDFAYIVIIGFDIFSSYSKNYI